MGENWAIIVGINNYDNLQPLKYAKRDAEAMKAWFEDEANFDQVFLFTEDSAPIPANPPIPTQPIQGRFKRFLNAQFEKPLLKPEDNLWFFFAGHGKRFVDQDYLMFLDSDPTDYTTAISVDYVTQRLRRCGADNVVLFIDACRDEGDRSGLGVGMQEHKGVITFYSCAANQKSWEIDELQHGSFTYSLLEGLRLQGEANCATVERLEQHLRYKVPQLNAHYRKSQQNPSLKAEPPYKMYYILLEQAARIKDVEPLKYQASYAENRGDLLLAKQLWVRVLAVSRGDWQAVESIERIAIRQGGSFEPTIKNEPKIPASGGRSTKELRLAHKQAEEDLPLNLSKPNSNISSNQGIKMKGITWLHLSDWHQEGRELTRDRQRLRDAFIKDIEQRSIINPNLAKIDFIIFSGDITKSGKKEQYEAAKEYLFEPLLQATGVSSERLFIVPGNHDLDEGKFRYLPGGLDRPVQSIRTFEEWLEKEEDRDYLLKPFETYKKFVAQYTGQENPDYASVRQLVINDQKISLLGLNSAIACRRYRDPHNNNQVRDQGRLIVGLCQIEDAIAKTPDSYMRIAVQHHPFKWLDDQEEFRINQSLGNSCQFILFGHEHIGQCEKRQGTHGEYIIIPAGASYDTIDYKNAYNFVNLNFEDGRGTIYFRRWDNETRVFIEDIGKNQITRSGNYSFNLPESLVPK